MSDCVYDLPTQDQCIIEQVYLGMVNAHHLIVSFWEHSLQHTSQLRGVVQEESKLVTVATSEPAKHCSRVGFPARPTKMVQEYRAGERRCPVQRL